MADHSANQCRQVRPGQANSHLAHGILALGISLLVHGLILVLGYFSTTAGFPEQGPARPQGRVPDASILRQAESSPLTGIGIGIGDASPKSPSAASITDVARRIPSTPISTAIGRPGESESPLRRDTAPIGIGFSGMVGTGGMAPFGTVGGVDAAPPQSPFMGVSDRAHRIAYICDASGPMVNVQDELKRKLKESITALKPSQSFNILFFNEAGVETFSSASLLVATPRVKHQAMGEGDGWIDEHYRVQLGADPIPALQKAFAQRPELVYLLTCGLSNRKDPRLPERVRAEIQRLNTAGRVHVSTILVLPWPREQRLARKDNLGEQVQNDVDVLTLIAKENGGRFALAVVD
jgi:hypothetical protein